MDLEQLNRGREIAQPPRSQIDQIHSAEQIRGRLGQKDLTTMSGDGPHDALNRAARQAARDPDWRSEYHRHRPMVERTIAWLTRGNRRLRYRGTPKNDHWLHHRVATLNLRRLINLGLAHNGTRWALA